MPTVANVVEFLEQFAPRELAADWDNVGLLLGERNVEVERMMTCLTVTSESAAEAIEGRVHLIVTHHPILFRGVKSLNDDTPEGRMVLSLARAGVAVYSPHTAFDNTRGGINELLARCLGLVDVRPLRRADERKQMKIVVFVPESDLNRVAEAMFAAGAGNIGEYRECSFRLAGVGSFHGSEAANPTVGRKGRREEANEWRLEAICPANRVEEVVAAIRRTHSYEEPAFDVYPLLAPLSGNGEGRIGTLEPSRALGELAAAVKAALRTGPIQVIGDLQSAIRRVAIVCGAGGEMMPDALRGQADVFLTGEMRLHDYLHARAHGLALILPGHYATERCGVEDLAERLGKQFPRINVWASKRESDPVNWL